MKMELSLTPVIIMVLVVAAIWIIIEMKRFKHKIFAVILILMILFTYISFNSVISKHDINLKTVEGLKTAGSLYLSWLGSIFTNLKTITSNAIGMDWTPNETEVDLKPDNS